jgi:hypothetical protein
MVSASMIILGKMRSKLLGSKVDEKVIIPGIIRGDVEETIIREIHVDGWAGSFWRKCHNEFGEDEIFLALGCWKFKVILLKEDGPSWKFTINFSRIEKVLHGVGICDDFGGAKQDIVV